MKVKIIPALDDNYMYLIIDESTMEAAVVDPVEHKKVLKTVSEEGVKLKAILTTHHHWDHAGGNEDLVKLQKGLVVYAGDENAAAVTDLVSHSKKINIGSLNVTCLLTPCHTKGHVCYFVEDKDKKCSPAVFTGDTLFSAGCGKFFEGNAEQMYNALVKILGCLPDETLVYCGHEYTANNLLFAVHVEPENEVIQETLKWAKSKKAAREPTIPSTIAKEKTFNPFMRVHEVSVQKHTGAENPVKVMEKLRNEKNNFSKRV